MKNYILKLTSGTTYKLYEGTTLVSDADLTTLFATAGSAYLSFDFDDGTPTAADELTITNSSDTAVITNTGLTDAIAENKNYKGTWSASATAFDSFEELEGVAMDESQLSRLIHQTKANPYVGLTSNQYTTRVPQEDIAPEGWYYWEKGKTYLPSLTGVSVGVRGLLYVRYAPPTASDMDYTYICYGWTEVEATARLHEAGVIGFCGAVQKRGSSSRGSLYCSPYIYNALDIQTSFTDAPKVALSAIQGKILNEKIPIVPTDTDFNALWENA